MANLSFIYGTMESGKTTKLLQDNFNYNKHDLKTVIIKPLIDIKGNDYVINRMNEKLKVDILLDKDESIIKKDYYNIYRDATAILVDEAQFLSEKQIIELWEIAHELDISVNCYGLKSNFKGIPFEGTKTLFGFADQKTELGVTCKCGKNAVFNARLVNGDYQYDGDDIAIDGFSNVKYEPLCSDCYLESVYSKKKIRK